MRKIEANKIVIKIGTNTITNKHGLLDMSVMRRLVNQISKIKNEKKNVIIITSGAIGAGMQELRLKQKPKDVVGKQVCAAIGQSILMMHYNALFSRYSIKIAQILLTHDDFTNKKTYTNFCNMLGKLLDLGVIPIINENDPISIDEIGPSFGDNDILSALIAGKISADLLIILTNVGGLYTKDPNDKDAILIKEVKGIDKKIELMAGNPSQLGTGGMKSKIKAAKLATKAGTTVVIANGRTSNVLVKILNNESIGTIFYHSI